MKNANQTQKRARVYEIAKSQFLNQKEISKLAKVSEKSVGVFFKEWRERDSVKVNIIKGLLKKLEDLSNSNEVSSIEIKNMMDNIDKIQKQLILNKEYYL